MRILRSIPIALAAAALGAPAAGAATTYDARISAIEVLQVTQYPGIQVRQAGTPLVKYSGVALRQGVRTFARVYVNTGPGGPTVPNVTAHLRGFEVSGTSVTQLTGGPLRPYTGDAQVGAGNGDSHVPSDAERDDPRGAFLFEIPIEWTLPGNGPATRFQVELLSPPADSSFTPCQTTACNVNNQLAVDGMVFRQMCCVDVAVAKVVTTENGQEVGPTFTPSSVLSRGIEASSAVGVRLPSTYQDSINADQDVYLRRDGITYIDTTRLMGLLETLRVKQGADVAIAIGGARTNLAAGGAWIAFVKQGAPVAEIAHEYQHALGRLHAGRLAKGETMPPGCQAFDSFAELWSPNQLGMVDGAGIFPDGRFVTGFFGGEVRFSDYPVYMSRTQAPDQSALRNANVYDHQTYCLQFSTDTRWLSPRAWDTIVDVWRTGRYSCSRPRDFDAKDLAGAERYCNSVPVGTIGAPRAMMATRAAASVQTPAGQTPSAGLAVEAGLAADGAVTIEEVRPRPALPAPAGSPYELVVRDAGGAEIARSPMAVMAAHSHDGQIHPARLTGVAAAGLDRAATVEVHSGGAVVASRSRSANAPKVAFVSPAKGAVVGRSKQVDIRWTASDADGDKLATRVEWSSDGGAKWRPVASGPDGGRVRLPSDYFAGTARGVLRLHVSDGFNETVVLSERFTTVHRPPTVRILTPPDGARIRPGTLVNLQAEALDERNQPLTSIRWLDGKRRLGRGPSLSIRKLRRGRHVLRVLSTDAAGRTASAQIRVRVR